MSFYPSLETSQNYNIVAMIYQSIMPDGTSMMPMKRPLWDLLIEFEAQIVLTADTTGRLLIGIDMGPDRLDASLFHLSPPEGLMWHDACTLVFQPHA